MYNPIYKHLWVINKPAKGLTVSNPPILSTYPLPSNMAGKSLEIVAQKPKNGPSRKVSRNCFLRLWSAPPMLKIFGECCLAEPLQKYDLTSGYVKKISYSNVPFIVWLGSLFPIYGKSFKIPWFQSPPTSDLPIKDGDFPFPEGPTWDPHPVKYPSLVR